MAMNRKHIRFMILFGIATVTAFLGKEQLTARPVVSRSSNREFSDIGGHLVGSNPGGEGIGGNMSTGPVRYQVSYCMCCSRMRCMWCRKAESQLDDGNWWVRMDCNANPLPSEHISVQCAAPSRCLTKHCMGSYRLVGWQCMTSCLFCIFACCVRMRPC